ncbi:helix-turn-helix domain-containing protein [Castellaniella defragrans]|uniref:helix-turn-helix domain-containing protein n=1 Tax=Castellaniella defragrans TaxID=75697 RepID=UPI002AFE4433|nr:helix-turn-helix domain-containing protein [Castellaniella defragrans]
MKYFDHAPIFKLYGGREEWSGAERVHCETIASRSRLHNWHIRPHRHSGLYQILHLQRGRAVVCLDEARHAVDGPAVIEVPQAFVHGFEFDEDCAGHVVTIAYPLLMRLVRLLGPRAAPPPQPVLHALADEDGANLSEAFAQLNARYLTQEEFRDARIEAWLTLIYARLRSRRPGTEPGAPPRPRGLEHHTRFGELLEASYAAHHDVAWYAARLGMTAAHLNVITRAHAGKSPLQLIHERLALEAGRSLIYTSMTIGEISDALGFSEPAHFTRFFRKAAGESPRAFRRRAWEQGRAAAAPAQAPGSSAGAALASSAAPGRA